MKRLIILACSNTKVQHKFLMPAIERYNGTAYQIVRKFLRTVPDAHLYHDFLILSAEFGLISADLRISYYDRLMTVERAKELNEETLSQLDTIFRSYPYRGVFVYMGKTYRRAIEGIDDFHPNIQYSHGWIGKQNSQLCKFLYDGEAYA